MVIADSTLRHRLRNVYFIWGRGKTTIANKLREQYGFYVYSTDESRERQMRIADPADQPYMCRDFQKEYGVESFWELPNEVIAEREEHFVREMTPMMIAELIALAEVHPVILCEGDLDYHAVAPIATHCVHLCNCGTAFDWFDRPDHEDLTAAVNKRTDLSAEEKRQLIEKAYALVGGKEAAVPDWVTELGIRNINWNDSTTAAQTASEVAGYFGFSQRRVVK